LVESIIRTILDTDSLLLKQSLFGEGKFLQRVQEAYAKNDLAMAATKGCRLGYMGHVVRTCSAMAYLLDRDLKLKHTLLADRGSEWEAFVNGPLHRDNQAHNASLGGGAPPFPDPEDPGAGLGAGAAPGSQPVGDYGGSTVSSIGGGRVGTTTGGVEDEGERDEDSFAFGDEDDGLGSYTNNYGLRADDDEEWTHHADTGPVQFQSEWPEYSASSSPATAAGGNANAGVGRGHGRDEEEHSDSSDDEPVAGTISPPVEAEIGSGSSDEDEEDAFDPRATEPGKTRKKNLVEKRERSPRPKVRSVILNLKNLAMANRAIP